MLRLNKLSRTVLPRLQNQFAFYSTKRFTLEHEWVKVENGVGTVGLTDYAQKALGEVVFVELPSLHTKLSQKDVLGAVESVKAASDIYAPVSGEVVEVNESLSQQPNLLNEAPEEEGWLAKIKLTDESELKNLLDDAAYKAHCENASH